MEKQRHFKQLTERDRYRIEYMLEERKTVHEIALVLGKDDSTIYRELKRGTVMQRNTLLEEHEKYQRIGNLSVLRPKQTCINGVKVLILSVQ